MLFLHSLFCLSTTKVIQLTFLKS